MRNIAFPIYAYHQQQVKEIINEIIEKTQDGELNFNIDLSGRDDLTESDLQYIQEEVSKRL
jgi:hypothetical protein